MTDLLELAARCEKATGPDRELDKAMFQALPFGVGGSIAGIPSFTASLDAAMTLVSEGWRFAGSETLHGDFYAHLITRELAEHGGRDHAEATADTLALALCAAALRARAT